MLTQWGKVWIYIYIYMGSNGMMIIHHKKKSYIINEILKLKFECCLIMHLQKLRIKETNILIKLTLINTIVLN